MVIYKSACVVTNVKTGEVLAIVSKPDFDPNTIVQDWDKFVEEEQTKNSSVLLNRVTQGLYPPGSTFKMITSLQYIREHNTSVDDYHFNCNGRFTHGNTSIQCYHGANHGSEDFYKAFAKSCNSAFSSIGVGLDRNAYGNTLNELLFNKDLPLDIIYSKSILDVDDSVSDDDMSNLAAMVVRLFTKATNQGDLNAARTVIEWAGMAPLQQERENEAIAKMSQVMQLASGNNDDEGDVEDVVFYIPDNGRNAASDEGLVTVSEDGK